MLRTSSEIREPIRFIKNNLKKDLVCAEVGVYHGNNSLQMLKYLSIKKLYLIDMWEDWHLKFENGHSKIQRSNEGMYKHVLKRFSTYSNIEFIRQKSMDAVKKFKNKSLDFVYVDANHSYDFFLEDLYAWEKKVKTNGVLCGHDYAFSGVNKAIKTYLKTHPRKLQTYNSVRGDWYWVVP